MPQSPDESKIAYELPDDERPASAAPTLEYEQVSKRHDPYLALRFRSFRLFQVGYLISVIGSQMMEVAVGWALYQRTKSPMSLGWVGLVTAAPVILLALPAGHLADRMNRRRVVIFTQICWAACIFILPIASLAHSVGWIYLLLLLAAIAKAIGGPARSAMLPSVVPPEAFANAVTWNSSGFQIAAMVGPALGGFLVQFSVPATYIAAAFSALLFALMLLPVKIRQTPIRKEPVTLRSLGAGIEFVWSRQIILATITLDLFAVLLGGAEYLLPVFATDYLHVGAVGFGWMRAMPAIGALAMGMTIAHLPPMKRAGRAMLMAVVGFGAATIVFGLSRNYWLSLAMLLLTGAFDNISVLVRHTLVQVLTPDDMRGRVSAINNVFIGASNELGGFESGLTAKLFNPIISVVCGGIGTILVVLTVAVIWPQVRRFGSLVHAKPED
jgi:MFS family permease